MHSALISIVQKGHMIDSLSILLAGMAQNCYYTELHLLLIHTYS